MCVRACICLCVWSCVCQTAHTHAKQGTLCVVARVHLSEVSSFLAQIWGWNLRFVKLALSSSGLLFSVFNSPEKGWISCFQLLEGCISAGVYSSVGSVRLEFRKPLSSVLSTNKPGMGVHTVIPALKQSRSPRSPQRKKAAGKMSHIKTRQKGNSTQSWSYQSYTLNMNDTNNTNDTYVIIHF